MAAQHCSCCESPVVFKDKHARYYHNTKMNKRVSITVAQNDNKQLDSFFNIVRNILINPMRLLMPL